MKEETKLTKDNLLTMLRESIRDTENPLYNSMFAYNDEAASLCSVVDKIKSSETQVFLVKVKTKNGKKLTVITDA